MPGKQGERVINIMDFKMNDPLYMLRVNVGKARCVVSHDKDWEPERISCTHSWE